MIIIYSNLGLLWLLLAFLLAVTMQSAGIIIDKEGNYFLEIVTTSIVLFDFCFRFIVRKNRKSRELKDITKDVSSHWLIGSKFGGSLFFLPAYIFSILAYLFLIFVVQI